MVDHRAFAGSSFISTFRIASGWCSPASPTKVQSDRQLVLERPVNSQFPFGAILHKLRGLVRRRTLGKGKGCDIGYALAVSSCEGANSVEHVPSQPLMRSPLSRSQTPTAPRRAVGFFRSGCSSGCPAELITQLTSDWQNFNANPFSRRRQQP